MKDPVWNPYLDHRTALFVEARVFPEFAEVRDEVGGEIERFELEYFWNYFEPQA